MCNQSRLPRSPQTDQVAGSLQPSAGLGPAAQSWRPRRRLNALAALVQLMGLALMAVPAVGCADRNRYVSVGYTTRPVVEFPPDVLVIEIHKPNYPHRATEDGIVRDEQMRWYNQFIRHIETRLRQAAPHVLILNREDRLSMDPVERERDIYRDPDQRSAEHEGRASRRTPDAVIVPRIVVSTKDQLSWEPPSAGERLASTVADYIPYAPAPRAEPKARYRRQVNVSCEVHMSQAGIPPVMLVTYACDLQASDYTEPGRWYGIDSGKRRHEMLSSDRLIQWLIVEHCDNFLARLIPLERTLRAELRDVSRRASRAIDRLNSGDYEQARAAACKAWDESGCDDHAAAFVLGVLAEREGDWREALTWYSRAANLSPTQDEYLNAQERAQDALNTSFMRSAAK